MLLNGTCIYINCVFEKVDVIFVKKKKKHWRILYKISLYGYKIFRDSLKSIGCSLFCITN